MPLQTLEPGTDLRPVPIHAYILSTLYYLSLYAAPHVAAAACLPHF